MVVGIRGHPYNRRRKRRKEKEEKSIENINSTLLD